MNKNPGTSECTCAETSCSEHERPLVGTGLKAHIGAFVIVNTFLVAVWKLSKVSYPWFLWILAGWGTGLAFHIFGRSLIRNALH